MRRSPAKKPRPQEAIISKSGSTSTVTILNEPVSNADAIPNETLNRTRPTASSIATTINKSLVRGPSALYCLTTIKVAAGAVAAAIAPRVIADESERILGAIK